MDINALNLQVWFLTALYEKERQERLALEARTSAWWSYVKSLEHQSQGFFVQVHTQEFQINRLLKLQQLSDENKCLLQALQTRVEMLEQKIEAQAQKLQREMKEIRVFDQQFAGCLHEYMQPLIDAVTP